MAGSLFALLFLGAITVGVILIVRKVMDKREDGRDAGGDVIVYLVLALAVGVAAFGLAELGQAAFPGDDFIGDGNRRVATSLAAIVVAAPIAGFLWRRQTQRRALFPRSAGWTVYLAIIEAVFMTATVLAAFAILDWLLADGNMPTWTDIVVFAAVVTLHELAARRTPPQSDGADLPRVVGSAIGLITTAIGVWGLLFWAFTRIYGSFQVIAGEPAELGTWLALVIVGVPVWWYRWLRPWDQEPGTPRQFWTFVSSGAGLLTAVGATVWIVSQALIFLFGDTPPAGDHFDVLPAQLATLLVALVVWAHHRRLLGSERTNPLRAYEYAMAAAGLLATIVAATALTSLALGPADLVDPSPETLVSASISLVAALAIWGWFWRKVTSVPREAEAGTGPRRFYLIGGSVITGLGAAGALIGTLVVLFQRLLGVSEGETLVVQASLFIYSGLALWHLLRTNGGDRDLIVSEEVVTPYSVTIICAHPGMIAKAFPKEASLRVVYRGDELGVIDDDMAAAIVDAVGHRSSLVWVDDTGFRVAPARTG